MLFCGVLALAHSLSSGGLVQAHCLNYHLFAEDPHISIATQLSFLSPHFCANCHIHCIPQTLQINVSKIELSFPPVLSSSTCFSYLHLHSSLSRWHHHPEICKSHQTPISQPFFQSTIKFGFFLQLHLPPQSSLCSGSLTQSISATL